MKTKQEQIKAMTKDDIKKALTCCSNPSISYCKNCPYANYGEFDCCNGKMCKDALALITEQEKSIQVAQDSILSLAQQNQEYREQQVKQAKIDVLNKVMNYINNKIENDYGDMSDSVNYLTINIDDFDDFIDEFIKEVENE